MNTGLSERDTAVLKEIFDKYPSVTLVYIFGSRAKETHKTGSDIDIAIMNDGVDDDSLIRLKEEFEESALPYSIDLVYFPELHAKELKEHIKRVGVKFYER